MVLDGRGSGASGSDDLGPPEGRDGRNRYEQKWRYGENHRVKKNGIERMVAYALRDRSSHDLRTHVRHDTQRTACGHQALDLVLRLSVHGHVHDLLHVRRDPVLSLKKNSYRDDHDRGHVHDHGLGLELVAEEFETATRFDEKMRRDCWVPRLLDPV